MSKKGNRLFEALTKARKEKEITQAEISEQVGVHDGNFWSTVKRGTVKYDKLCEVVEILECELIIVHKDNLKTTILTNKNK